MGYSVEGRLCAFGTEKLFTPPAELYNVNFNIKDIRKRNDFRLFLNMLHDKKSCF
jgi:hypothetical protein